MTQRNALKAKLIAQAIYTFIGVLVWTLIVNVVRDGFPHYALGFIGMLVLAPMLYRTWKLITALPETR